MTLIELLLIITNAGFLIWILHLKSQVKQINDALDSTPPPPETLTVTELRQLQASMHELVDSIETYTDQQMHKMRLQVDSMQILCDRLEKRLQEAEANLQQQEAASQAAQMGPMATGTSGSVTRVVPLSPESSGSRHSQRERVLELHQRGWGADQIARELRITKGEVQLIVNLP